MRCAAAAAAVAAAVAPPPGADAEAAPADDDEPADLCAALPPDAAGDWAQALRGREITAIAVDYAPYSIFDPSGPWTGRDIDVATAIADVGGFNITFITGVLPNMSAGETWTDSLAHDVSRAHFVASWYRDTSERRRSGFSFTTPILDDSPVLLLPKSEEEPPDFWAMAFYFVKPFTPTGYGVILLLWLSSSLATYLVEKARRSNWAVRGGALRNKLNRREQREVRRRRKDDDIEHGRCPARAHSPGEGPMVSPSAPQVRWRSIAIDDVDSVPSLSTESSRGYYSKPFDALSTGMMGLLGQDQQMPNSRFGRSITLFQSFAVLIVTTLYTAQLTNFLIHETTLSPISSLDEFVHLGLTACVERGVSLEDQIKKRFPLLRTRPYGLHVNNKTEMLRTVVDGGDCQGFIVGHSEATLVLAGGPHHGGKLGCEMRAIPVHDMGATASFPTMTNCSRAPGGGWHCASLCSGVVGKALSAIISELDETGVIRAIERKWVNIVGSDDAMRSYCPYRAPIASEPVRLDYRYLAGLALVCIVPTLLIFIGAVVWHFFPYAAAFTFCVAPEARAEQVLRDELRSVLGGDDPDFDRAKEIKAEMELVRDVPQRRLHYLRNEYERVLTAEDYESAQKLWVEMGRVRGHAAAFAAAASAAEREEVLRTMRTHLPREMVGSPRLGVNGAEPASSPPACLAALTPPAQLLAPPAGGGAGGGGGAVRWRRSVPSDPLPPGCPPAPEQAPAQQQQREQGARGAAGELKGVPALAPPPPPARRSDGGAVPAGGDGGATKARRERKEAKQPREGSRSRDRRATPDKRGESASPSAKKTRKKEDKKEDGKKEDKKEDKKDKKKTKKKHKRSSSD